MLATSDFPTLAEIKRRAVEESIERCGSMAGAARELRIGVATVKRWIDEWRASDLRHLPRIAHKVGVLEDELDVLFRRCNQTALVNARPSSHAAVSRQIAEALRLLGRRRVPWGLALASPALQST